MLTTAQLQILKTHITNSPDLSSQPNNATGHAEISNLMNLPASPNFTVWKTTVTVRQVMESINGSELGGLTTGNHTRLQTVIIGFTEGVNPSKADIRAMLDDIFSGAGGTNTRAALLVLYKRLATRGEKLYATGTGTDPSPATMGFEGIITPGDVEAARQLP